MEINKRTILWIVFAVSLVVLWNDWMVANGKQSMFSAQPPAKVAQAPNPAKPNDLPTAATPTPAGTVPGTPAAPAPVQTQVITVTTDVYKVDIDTAGGVIRRLELLKYRDKVDHTKNQVLLYSRGADHGSSFGWRTERPGFAPLPRRSSIRWNVCTWTT